MKVPFASLGRLPIATILIFALGRAIPGTASARIVRIVIESRSPADGGRSFGQVGAYEILTGHIYGEIDPKDPHNTIITDIDLAPRNNRGMVEYAATFMLETPVDLSKTNGVLIYSVPNRGNRVGASYLGVHGESGNEFVRKRGYMILHSGWQGDLSPHVGRETLEVPIAKNPDGSSVIGVSFARFIDMPPDAKTLWLPSYHSAASLDTARAILTKRAANFGQVIPIASSDWAFSDCTDEPFPGKPDANRISVNGGFDPVFSYELTYIAKDPLVLGVGLAATRDIVSFFRYETNNRANPLAGHVSHTIGQGNSQSGNFVRTFICLGFNQDEDGRMVWDGANPNIAARQLAINFRFAHPGNIAALYDPGSEATLWWGAYTDAIHGSKPTSLLDRCRANDAPKVVETFGSAEFWNLRMSPDLVGTKADQDIPLPPNVRRYYFPGTTHGGGGGGISTDLPDPPKGFELPYNPNSEAYSMRALLVMLTDWITKGIAPVPSVYPKLADGQLVPPDHHSMGFPIIPGQPLPDNLINPLYDYDFGPTFNYQDLSGVMTIQPPLIKGILPQLVPKVDADGNETSGVPSVLNLVPLGTYVGWNVVATGFYKGYNAGLFGGYIPFTKTKAERLASGDPRLSVEERYHDHAGYVAQVKKAVEQLTSERFLLPEDADRLMHEAEASNVLR